MIYQATGRLFSHQGLRVLNSHESIRDVLAQSGCRVLWLCLRLCLFTVYLAGADAVAGSGASRYLSNSLPGVSELDKSDARSHASQKSCQPGVMPARSHDNQESSFNGLSSGQRAKRVEAPQRVPRAPPGPSQPSVGSPGFPAAGDSGEPVAEGDGRVRQSEKV